SLPPLLHQPRRDQLRHREPRPLAAGQHLVPGARRVADAEAPEDRLAQPAPGQVLPRLGSLPGLPEVRRVERRGSLQELAQPGPAPPHLLGARIRLLQLELDPEALRQALEGLRKRQPLLLLDELEHVAPGLAPEAVVEILAG